MLRAVRYARSLRPYDVRAVHFVVDVEQAAAGRGGLGDQPGLDIGLDLIECPDRRISRAALELAARITADGSTQVTLLLPRRTYSPLLGRLLHDRTADEIAEVVSRLPHAAATIVPFDVAHPIVEHSRTAVPTLPAQLHWARSPDTIRTDTMTPAPAALNGLPPSGDVHGHPSRRDAARFGDVAGAGHRPGPGPYRQRDPRLGGPGAAGRALRPDRRDRGDVLRPAQIQGVEPGATLRVEGMVGSDGGRLAMLNPLYELVLPPEGRE